MSTMEDLWLGKEYEHARDPNMIAPMKFGAIEQGMIQYEPKMRWNKNVKESRKRVCWVCGKETSNHWVHNWRIQGNTSIDGKATSSKISNVKCDCCYQKYMENKRK